MNHITDPTNKCTHGLRRYYQPDHLCTGYHLVLDQCDNVDPTNNAGMSWKVKPRPWPEGTTRTSSQSRLTIDIVEMIDTSVILTMVVQRPR